MVSTTGKMRASIKHAHIAACTIVLAYYAAAALGGTPQLLRNINTTLIPAGYGLVAMSGYVLCIVDNLSAQELWRSDATSAGTYRVVVTNSGPVSSASEQYPLLQKVGSRVQQHDANGHRNDWREYRRQRRAQWRRGD